MASEFARSRNGWSRWHVRHRAVTSMRSSEPSSTVAAACRSRRSSRVPARASGTWSASSSEDVGLSPKTFSRIVRLQAALRRVRGGARADRRRARMRLLRPGAHDARLSRAGVDVAGSVAITRRRSRSALRRGTRPEPGQLPLLDRKARACAHVRRGTLRIESSLRVGWAALSQRPGAGSRQSGWRACHVPSGPGGAVRRTNARPLTIRHEPRGSGLCPRHRRDERGVQHLQRRAAEAAAVSGAAGPRRGVRHAACVRDVPGVVPEIHGLEDAEHRLCRDRRLGAGRLHAHRCRAIPAVFKALPPPRRSSTSSECRRRSGGGTPSRKRSSEGRSSSCSLTICGPGSSMPIRQSWGAA